MAHIKSQAILTRIREVLDDSAGDLRTIAYDRFAGDLPEGLDPSAIQFRAVTSARVEARITGKRVSPASPPALGNLRIYELDVEVKVIRLVETADQLDDAERDALNALAAEDGDIIAQALGYPGNLTATEAGEPTDLVSGMLVYESDSTSVDGRISEGAQTLTTTHLFRGHAIARPATA